MPRCLVALGSNLGDTAVSLAQAIERIGQIAGTRLVCTSRVVDSQPVGGPAGQGAFRNQVAAIETDRTPHELLAELQAIEQRLDRRRGERWAARTIDLDLLMYDEQVVDTRGLRVPHPRMTFRPFVMEPAVEVAGAWRHPELGATLVEIDQTRCTGSDAIRIAGEKGLCEGVARAAIALGAELLPPHSSGEHRLSVQGGRPVNDAPPRLQILAGNEVAATPATPLLRLDSTVDASLIPQEVAAAVACLWPGLGRGAGRRVE